jgi:hypothetical protein
MKDGVLKMASLSREDLNKRLCIRIYDLRNFDIDTSILRDFTHLYEKSHWDYISNYQRLDDKFVEDFSSQLNWEYLLRNHKRFTNDFLIKMRKTIGNNAFVELFHRRDFSEKDLEKMRIPKHNRKFWTAICTYQNVSKEFVTKNIDRVDMRSLLSNRNVRGDFREELQTLSKLS